MILIKLSVVLVADFTN